MKSAYRVAMEAMKNDGHEESQSGQVMTNFWRPIWQVKTPDKVKMFMWRACQNILRTHKVKLKRGEEYQGMMCANSVEEKQKRVWKLTPIVTQK